MSSLACRMAWQQENTCSNPRKRSGYPEAWYTWSFILGVRGSEGRLEQRRDSKSVWGCILCVLWMPLQSTMDQVTQKPQKFIPSQFWRLEVQIRVSAGLVSSEPSLLGWWLAIFCLCPHLASPVCLYLCVCVLSSSACRNAHYIWLGCTLMTSC